MNQTNRLFAAVAAAALAFAHEPAPGGALGAFAAQDEDIDDDIEEDVESDVEDDIESDVEDDIESDVEDDIESDVEDDIESDVEDDIESDVEDDIESDVEDDIESDVEDDIESDVEDDIESDVEDDIESDVEDDIEEDIELQIEGALEDDIEEDIEDDVEDDVADDLEEDLEDDIEDDLEDDFEDELDDDVEDDVEDEVDDDFDDDERFDEDDDDGGEYDDEGDDEEDEGEDEEDDDDERNDDDEDDDSRYGRRGNRYLEIDVDVDVGEFVADERIVLLDPGNLRALRESPVEILSSNRLRAIDLIVARIATPPSGNLDAQTQAILAIAPEAEIDFNHVFRPEEAAPIAPSLKRRSPQRTATLPEGFMPTFFMPASGNARLRLGQIDTRVNHRHPALRSGRIRQRAFIVRGVGKAKDQPSDHGTAVAAILVGNDRDYVGLAPGASLFAASVFARDGDNGVAASAESLVRAVDWMIEKRVDVINMSLSGPANRVLQTAIERARGQGAMVVAAVGNAGPGAPAAYPAAYEGVVGVTAVNARRRVYRLAGRGAHVDFAAPGVDIVVASGADGYALESGTSMAAPFASALLAQRRAAIGDASAGIDPVAELRRLSTDLGQVGKDRTYGYGLLTP